MNKDLIRKLPKVDQLLNEIQLLELEKTIPYSIILESTREVLDMLREKVLHSEGEISEDLFEQKNLLGYIVSCAQKKYSNSLTRVINCTGVTLHTNLGRANLSEKACESVSRVAERYSNLEYDVELGKRGSRHSHVEKVIRDITGAEAAMVVNNNAAATMLCLSVMGQGKEIIVSRGELVEIGGSFRIPDIMVQSGAELVEVGTTNKTRIQDYKNSITEKTSALMKVHTSNYRIVGFTEDVSLSELVDLGRSENLPVIYDMGCGLLLNLSEYGINEPTVVDSMKEGIDIILFSGDKLLGGPQGGIIAGKKCYIDKMKKHPLARILRVDKMTLAAMEATFKEYYDERNAIENIPVLNSLCIKKDELKNKAEKLADGINKKTGKFKAAVEVCSDQIGGGSAPMILLDGYCVTIEHDSLKAQKIEERLRTGETPIVVRINDEKVLLGVRTIFEDEFDIIINRLNEIDS